MPSRFSFKASASAAIISAALTVATTSGQASGPITVTVHVTGNGKVTSPDIPINCGMGANQCSTKVQLLFKAPLNAEPSAGAKFEGWNGKGPTAFGYQGACYINSGGVCLLLFDGTYEKMDVYAKFSGGSGATNNAAETKCPPKCDKKQLPDPHIREKLNQKIMKVQPQQ